MITPKIYYRLCLIQGLCLAVGLGVPFILHTYTPVLGKLNLQGVLLAWFTFMGTWGLLTAGTGLILLQQFRTHSQANGKTEPARSTYSVGVKENTPLTLRLFMGDEPIQDDQPDWKSRWRHTS